VYVDGTEAGFQKTMGEGGVTDDIDHLFCCYDNHIGRCIPGTKDDMKCDFISKKKPCSKGGHRKIIGKKSPNHFCHCLLNLHVFTSAMLHQ